MDLYLVLYKDEQLAIKFTKPPWELLQQGARIFRCNPATSLGYIEWWLQSDQKDNRYILEIF